MKSELFKEIVIDHEKTYSTTINPQKDTLIQYIIHEIYRQCSLGIQAGSTKMPVLQAIYIVSANQNLQHIFLTVSCKCMSGLQSQT